MPAQRNKGKHRKSGAFLFDRGFERVGGSIRDTPKTRVEHDGFLASGAHAASDAGRKIKRTSTSALSIKVAFEEFVVAQTAKGFAVSTIQNYHSHFRSISKHIDIETPFCELGQTDIEGMIVSMRESGLATNSISSYIRVFKTFMNWSQQQGYTTLTVPNYKQVETAKDPYTDEELCLLLENQKQTVIFANTAIGLSSIFF